MNIVYMFGGGFLAFLAMSVIFTRGVQGIKNTIRLLFVDTGKDKRSKEDMTKFAYKMWIFMFVLSFFSFSILWYCTLLLWFFTAVVFIQFAILWYKNGFFLPKLLLLTTAVLLGSFAVTSLIRTLLLPFIKR